MQIHRVRGSSLRDALLRAQDAYGEDAVVIQEESVPGGGVTLSVAKRETPRARTLATQPERDPARVPIVREVAQRLARTGTSQEFSAAICAEVREWPDPNVHVMDRAAECIGKRFPPVKLGRLDAGTRVLAFVGLTGVGKTTTIVKLATRMLRAGRRVELATLDVQRVGAVEQARAWSRELAVPLSVIRPGVKPHAKAFEGSGVDVVLLDTTGNPLVDVERLQELQQSFTGARVAFGTWLVLPATASRVSLEMVTRAYAPLAPEGVVITKLDETREPAAVLEHVLAAQLGVAFLSNGPDVSLHLQRSGPEACADLFLRGRLS